PGRWPPAALGPRSCAGQGRAPAAGPAPAGRHGRGRPAGPPIAKRRLNPFARRTFQGLRRPGMPMRTLVAVASLAALLAACGQPAREPAPTGPPAEAPVPDQAPTPPAGGEQGGTADWRQVASAADASNLG